MTDQPKPCQATTKSGNPCKLTAQPGSDFCHVHASGTSSGAAPQANAAADAPVPVPVTNQPDFTALVAELNELAEELRAIQEPPPYSRERLLGLVKGNFERVSSALGMDAANQILASLQGASPKDALDPDTWKGLYYVINALVQAQTDSARSKIVERLNALPGFALLTDLRAGLQDATAKDLVDPNTWKGLYYILDATARAQAGDLKRKLLGDEE